MSSWMTSIGEALLYIEEHITDDITVDMVANHVNISSYYFQKGFAMLCGLSIAEYIRNRRLALAGNDLATGNEKIIDIAMKYGYDSPDSFSKAFYRFHGATPTAARKNHIMLKSFAPLKIKIADPYEGGEIPDGFIKKVIPAFTWAVFPCIGAMPEALQDVNEKIFSEWLPALKEYEFAAGYCVEMYDDPRNYLKGTLDEKYYSEIWIPVKKK